MKLSYKQKYQLLRNVILYFGLAGIFAKLFVEFFIQKGIIIFG